jgi:hypothetical protein
MPNYHQKLSSKYLQSLHAILIRDPTNAPKIWDRVPPWMLTGATKCSEDIHYSIKHISLML